MPEPPIISGDQCISALERIGYWVALIKGSHVRLRCTGRRPVTVPKHDELEQAFKVAIARAKKTSQ